MQLRSRLRRTVAGVCSLAALVGLLVGVPIIFWLLALS